MLVIFSRKKHTWSERLRLILRSFLKLEHFGYNNNNSEDFSLFNTINKVTKKVVCGNLMSRIKKLITKIKDSVELCKLSVTTIKLALINIFTL